MRQGGMRSAYGWRTGRRQVRESSIVWWCPFVKSGRESPQTQNPHRYEVSLRGMGMPPDRLARQRQFGSS